MAKRILVVDDSAAVRESVSYVLDQAGYEVVQAGDGLDALGMLDGTAFDLIVTDVNMPNMDGITLTGKVRELEAYKYTPVVVLTTESQESKMSAGKAAGATGWIVKPFNSEKLLQVVKRLAG
ncbi:two-component system response regulator [Alkalispirochaeta sphaeroplastigenens]|uniref:Two-component system response regulator n=1 Tax=Alkalispirochaeta sphaeroplastigenens TaxID=1187066 RepID=A0A2S4JGR6_9SPIO|nr:response regulator [Alkalispirochaeta sphaeroplastigenens]POQ98732.1 two-component system response regulator [Alkalispirochaeta sphaeroplastigenens]